MKKQNMIRWIAGAALGIACVGFGIHAYYRYEEREAAVQEMEARGQQENEDAEDQKNGILTWNGKKYRRNTAMRAILCMGIDTKGEMASQAVSDARLAAIAHAHARQHPGRRPQHLRQGRGAQRRAALLRHRKIILLRHITTQSPELLLRGLSLSPAPPATPTPRCGSHPENPTQHNGKTRGGSAGNRLSRIRNPARRYLRTFTMILRTLPSPTIGAWPSSGKKIVNCPGRSV